MKTKNNKHQVGLHVRVERFFRHRIVLAFVLTSMAIGLIKYETHLVSMIQQVYYGTGVSLVSGYTHHQEITRMPISYGPGVRFVTTSGE